MNNIIAALILGVAIIGAALIQGNFNEYNSCVRAVKAEPRLGHIPAEDLCRPGRQ